MPRLRKLIKSALLLPYLVLVLVGPGLHELPGFAHETAVAGASDSDANANVRSPGESTRGGGHCLVCHFITQAQIARDHCSAPLIRAAEFQSILTCPTIQACLHWHPASPRAPPMALADIS